MTPAAVEDGLGQEYPERIRWVGKGVTADDINAELDNLHRTAGGQAQILALARTLNLIVVPCSDSREREVERALNGLGSHSPSRTLVLREHGADRIDASLVMECEAPAGAGRVGLCHDRVVVNMDQARLEHSASFLVPLLVSDLPTVLWLPAPSAKPPDPRLLERAQYLLVDSASGTNGELSRLAELAAGIRVHDLAWGRLAYWRAAIAAAFEPRARRALLPEISEVELRHESGGAQAAWLLAGWIAARAGVNLAIRLEEAKRTGNCGGVDGVTFRAGSEVIDVDRSGATTSLRDMFAEALQPDPSFARGYEPAVNAAAAMQDGGR